MLVKSPIDKRNAWQPIPSVSEFFMMMCDYVTRSRPLIDQNFTAASVDMSDKRARLLANTKRVSLTEHSQHIDIKPLVSIEVVRCGVWHDTCYTAFQSHANC